MTHSVTSPPPIDALRRFIRIKCCTLQGQLPSLAGQEHGRTVPFPDIRNCFTEEMFQSRRELAALLIPPVPPGPICRLKLSAQLIKPT